MEDPATKSSSKPGSRFDRADVLVGVNTVEHKAITLRRDARAGVSPDRVESFAKMFSKRARFENKKAIWLKKSNKVTRKTLVSQIFSLILYFFGSFK